MKRKSILINYRFICGEHEINSHTIVNVPEDSNKTQIKRDVHEHMMGFWGTPAECSRKYQSYYYFGGEIAIEVNDWHVLNDVDIAVLRRLNLSRGL